MEPALSRLLQSRACKRGKTTVNVGMQENYFSSLPLNPEFLLAFQRHRDLQPD